MSLNLVRIVAMAVLGFCCARLGQSAVHGGTAPWLAVLLVGGIVVGAVTASTISYVEGRRPSRGRRS